MARISYLLGTLGALFLVSFAAAEKFDSDESLYYAVRQYTKLDMSLDGKEGFIHTGDPLSPEWNLTPLSWWTVGFYGGTLWMLFKLTGDNYWKDRALEFQERVKSKQYDRGTHDVGFIIMSTYGLALEYGGVDDVARREYEQIINETATSLSSRYHPLARCTRSWNSDNGLVTVIVDNMMNLELLFKAFEITGNQTFYEIAVNHADRTNEEHFREDGGCYHVVGYNETNGEVGRKYNAQGMADDSTWSRGLAWGIHGYATTYQKTGIRAYLERAEYSASYFINRLPSDSVPYWDFDAPVDSGEYQPRDASAGAIAAHAFLNLYEITGNKEKYFDAAENILNGLQNYRADSNPEYQLPAILVNGTVFFHQNEFNTAIVYADFYYLRAVDLHKQITARMHF